MIDDYTPDKVRELVATTPASGTQRSLGGIARLEVVAGPGGGGRACCLGATPLHTRTRHGGNCTIRGATRRRHAVGVGLMVQNPLLGGRARGAGGGEAVVGQPSGTRSAPQRQTVSMTFVARRSSMAA